MAVPHLTIAGVSKRHRSIHERPNEDAFIIDEQHGIAAVADGVTRPRTKNGAYPAESAAVASHAFVNAATEYLKTPRSHGEHAKEAVRTAMRRANDAIAQENARRHIPETVDFEYVDYLGTTGCVLWIPPHRKMAVVGFVGDVIAIHFRRNDERLLTRDQLIPCHRYTRARFRAIKGEITSEEANRQRLVWQRQHARNNAKACDPEGNRIGFGVMTGEPGALDFIETTAVRITSGDRFVLASDALRICLPQDDAIKTASSYHKIRQIRESLDKVDPGEAAQRLLARVRNAEFRTRATSDDATVVVVHIE